MGLPTLANLESDKWEYTVMGSRSKKTGKLPYYTITVKSEIIINCSCPAREFRRYQPCKHMKFTQKHTPHLKLG